MMDCFQTLVSNSPCAATPWGSPNGAMRRGWNGITISRDTIHIDGRAAEQSINQSNPCTHI
jgi:hypothetical protein